jgi:hypothetical protein
MPSVAQSLDNSPAIYATRKFITVFTTALYLKNVVFWDAMPCGSCKNWRFRRSYRLHHQGGKNLQGRIMLAVTNNFILLLALWFLPPWWWKQCIPPKRRCKWEPYGIVFQNTTFFVVPTVKLYILQSNCCHYMQMNSTSVFKNVMSEHIGV